VYSALAPAEPRNFIACLKYLFKAILLLVRKNQNREEQNRSGPKFGVPKRDCGVRVHL
jgi:hypothetical protein